MKDDSQRENQEKWTVSLVSTSKTEEKATPKEPAVRSRLIPSPICDSFDLKQVNKQRAF